MNLIMIGYSDAKNWFIINYNKLFTIFETKATKDSAIAFIQNQEQVAFK